MRRIENWLEIVTKKAKSFGGACLSNSCYSAVSKVNFQCARGHRFVSSASSIIHNNQWCRKCALLLDGLKISTKIAKSYSGKCLSHKYNGNKQNLLWECKEGHRWYASLGSVKDKHTWCPKCYDLTRSKKQRLKNGIQIARKIAKKYNGKCLSDTYINVMSKLDWECEYGHEWSASLNHIKSHKSWCPKCGYLKSARKANGACILKHWKTKKDVICVGSYEKKTVEYFNKNKINFRWQPKTFNLPNRRTYRPDLYLFSTKKWIEIKGYFWDDAREKWEWFHKEHPNSELWNEEKLIEMRIL